MGKVCEKSSNQLSFDFFPLYDTVTAYMMISIFCKQIIYCFMYSTYKLPTVADIPREFNVRLLRHSYGPKEAVFSAKGRVIFHSHS